MQLAVPKPWKLAAAVLGFLLVFLGLWGASALFGDADPRAAALAAALSVGFFWWLLHAVARRLAMAPFAAKGKVLRDAVVTIHGIEALDPHRHDIDLPPDYDDPDDLPPEHGFRFDLTIEPKPQGGVFSLYDPWEMTLVPSDFRIGSTFDEEDEEAFGHPIRELEIFVDGSYQRYDGDKLGEEARWRFVAELPEAMTSVRLFYYFQLFGPVIELGGRGRPGAKSG